MKTYVLQIRSGREQEVCHRLQQMGMDAFVPMKIMQLRSGGRWFEKTMLIFSQYLFLRTELTAEEYYRIRRVEGVIRFLGNGKPEPVSEAEEAYIRWLRNDGRPLGVSKVYWSAQGARLVLSGALRDFPNDEIEYRLRQRRAIIYITLCGRKRKLVLSCIAV